MEKYVYNSRKYQRTMALKFIVFMMISITTGLALVGYLAHNDAFILLKAVAEGYKDNSFSNQSLDQKIGIILLAFIMIYGIFFKAFTITFTDNGIDFDRTCNISYMQINHISIKTPQTNPILVINYQTFTPFLNRKTTQDKEINPKDFNISIEELLNSFPKNIPIINERD